MKADQERVKNLLTDTVTLLCRNGLQFQKEIKVQGLLGITLDDSEVFLVQIDERIGSLLGFNASSDAEMGGTAQQEPSLNESPYSVKHTGFSSNSAKQPFKHSLRPVRPASRFGGHRQSFPAVSKRRHRISPPLGRRGLNGAPRRDDEPSGVHQLLDGQQLEEQRDASNKGEDADTRVQIKKEERDDDDVILVGDDPDDKNVGDDRVAMMGSYATELTGNEAQDIYSEFSLLTNAPSQSGDLKDLMGGPSGGPFIGGVVRNYANQPGRMGSSSDLLNSSAPGNLMQWDVSNSSSLSQASQSFSTSPNRTMPSVGLCYCIKVHVCVTV